MSEVTSVVDQLGQQGESKGAKAPAVPAKSAKVAAMEEELKELELRAKRLEVAEKEANLQDIQERLDERKTRRANIVLLSRTNGETLKNIADADRKVQNRCNHRKGGNGAAGVVLGQGDSLYYAVIKHTILTGDMWIRCTRCGKTWKPPIREDFKVDAEYLAALQEYETAKNFPTNNHPSSSQQFKWSDNGDWARKQLRNSTLR